LRTGPRDLASAKLPFFFFGDLISSILYLPYFMIVINISTQIQNYRITKLMALEVVMLTLGFYFLVGQE